MPLPFLPSPHLHFTRLAAAALLLAALAIGLLPGLAAAAPAAGESDEVVRHRVADTDGEGLRVRKGPGLDSPILSRLPEGALVKVRDGDPIERDGERWFPVKSLEVQGWAASRYLVRATKSDLAANNVGADGPFADRVVAIARSATGQPYVWGGTKPGGFDCSGFVQWVYSRAGLEMPRLIPDQLALGKKVDRAALQPGDLLAFENTYTSGLSHVGIYIGNNLFQHASNEVAGVTVSSLKDAYWEARFVRAVRLR